MADSIEVDLGSSPAECDPQSRTIRGTACPADATTQRWGRTLRIPAGSVQLADRVPLLDGHDDSKALGLLTAGEWTEDGLMVAFKVSKTPAGDSALQLANDGVLGLSLGLRFSEEALKVVGDEVHLTESIAFEVSVTPLPAIQGTSIHSVTFAEPTSNQLKREQTMSDNDAAALDVAKLNGTLEQVNSTLLTLSQRPVPQPVPVSVVQEPAYSFNVQDLKLSLAGDAGAKERIERFFTEKFAVTQENASPLTPRGFRVDLYQGQRPFSRTLTQFISQEIIPDNNPFGVPFLKNATGPWVRDHVQYVEPELAEGAVWDTQVVVPKPVSGKVSVSQEALDLTGGQIANLLWDIFLVEFEKSLEKRMAEFLDGLTLPVDQIVSVDGTHADLADSFDDLMLSIDQDQVAGLAAASPLYRDFFRARDEDKRKLFAAVGQIVNGDGSANNRRSLDLNGALAVRSAETEHSYLMLDKSKIYQWTTVPTRFDLKTMVKSLEIGFWAYECHAILDLGSVIRVDHAA